MNARVRSSWRRLVSFHKDEAGNQTLEKVLILAVAVIVLTFAVKVGWPLVRDYTDRWLDQMGAGVHIGPGANE